MPKAITGTNKRASNFLASCLVFLLLFIIAPPSFVSGIERAFHAIDYSGEMFRHVPFAIFSGSKIIFSLLSFYAF